MNDMLSLLHRAIEENHKQSSKPDSHPKDREDLHNLLDDLYSVLLNTTEVSEISKKLKYFSEMFCANVINRGNYKI